MKVIIVAMGRSGGYRLGEWISTELNHTYYHEPLISGEKVTKEDRIVKYLLDEWRRMDTKPEYDILIGLIREDSTECAISHIKGNEIRNFRTPYEVSEEWLKRNEENIKRESLIMDSWKIEMESLPTDTLLSYEGIYNRGETKPLCELLGIHTPKYLHLLDTSNRLRKTKAGKRKPLI
jgi:hypothetical protein